MSTVLILGAASDIGFSIARKFASEKFNVQLAGRNPGQLQPFQTDITVRYGVDCSIHAFDAVAFENHQGFYDSLSPKPDITVYAIGYMNENEKVVDDFNETLKTIHANYTGAVSILNLIAKDYSRKKQGVIIGISSVAGNRGRQSNYMYGSAKAGFTAYLSGLRNKLYHDNVHVITVLPGFVFTKMTEHLELPKLLTAKPEQVAAAVYNAVKKKKDVIYIKWFWRWIMVLVTSVPEAIFKKKKL